MPVYGEHVVIDLCCGVGGWTDAFLACGCTVVGYDIRPDKRYKGHLILADVRELDGRAFSQALCIVASPPCDEFSLANPKRKEPTFVPDMSIVEACFRIGRESGRPLVLENVCGAQKFLGASVGHYGKFYLWGDGVPALLPQGPRWKDKYKMRSRSRHLRARIPLDLAAAVAHYMVDVAVAERSRSHRCPGEDQVTEGAPDGAGASVSSPVAEHRVFRLSESPSQAQSRRRARSGARRSIAQSFLEHYWRGGGYLMLAISRKIRGYLRRARRLAGLASLACHRWKHLLPGMQAGVGGLALAG